MFAALLACALVAPHADAAPKYQSGGPSLLTEGLDDLLGPPPQADPAPQANPAPQAEPPTQAAPAGRSFAPDPRLLNDLIQDRLDGAPAAPMLGEDLGQQRENPLERIQESMHSASGLIDRIDNQAAGVQQGIIADLDKLIAEMEKQCSGGQSQSPPPPGQQASQRSQPKPSDSEGESKPKPGEGQPGQASRSRSANAAGDSTLRLGQADAAEAAGQRADHLMKEAWGHLPQRLREQMLQGATGEFLPEYREEIERYFQRLAEEESRSGAR